MLHIHIHQVGAACGKASIEAVHVRIPDRAGGDRFVVDGFLEHGGDDDRNAALARQDLALVLSSLARFAEARARVSEAEARCWQDVIRTEFYNGIPVQVRVKEFVETEEYRRTKQELADLEEEYRRTGLPPGWARDP